MKKWKPAVWLLCAAPALILMAGCGPKAAGTWTAAGETGGAALVLNKDGTGTLNGQTPIKWTEDKNTVTLTPTSSVSGMSISFTATLSDDGKQLTIGGGSDLLPSETLTRQ